MTEYKLYNMVFCLFKDSFFRRLTFAIIPNISLYQSFFGLEDLGIDPEEPLTLHIQSKANRIVISFLIYYFNKEFLCIMSTYEELYIHP